MSARRLSSFVVVLLLAVAASSDRASRTGIPLQTVDSSSDEPSLLQTHTTLLAATLDSAFAAVKDCDIPRDKNSPPCCSGLQCPFKGGKCCPGTKSCCPGGTMCMQPMEGVPQHCQSKNFLRQMSDTLDAKVRYLKAAAAEKQRRTQIILNQVAAMTANAMAAQSMPAPIPQAQPVCTGSSPCTAADLLAPNSFSATALTNPDGSSLSAAQLLQQQQQQLQSQSQSDTSLPPYVPRQPSPERKDVSCVCPPVAPCRSSWCAPPPKCACDLFWNSHLQHEGKISLDDQEPGDENYNQQLNHTVPNPADDVATALARATAEAQAAAAAEQAAEAQAAEQDQQTLQELFDTHHPDYMSSVYDMAVKEALHISESIEALNDISALDLPELAPPTSLDKPTPVNATDQTMSGLDPANDPYVDKQRSSATNVAPLATDDNDDNRDDGPPMPGDSNYTPGSDPNNPAVAGVAGGSSVAQPSDAARNARHQQTYIVVNLQVNRTGAQQGGAYGLGAFGAQPPNIPKNDPNEQASNEPEAVDSADAREAKYTADHIRKQEVLARRILARQKLEMRSTYCVSRSPAGKGPLRTLMTVNSPTCGVDHAPTFEPYATFYAFPFPVAASRAFCVSSSRGSLWRMQVTPDATTCVSGSWNQEFVFYAYPTYHPGTAPYCVKESTSGNTVTRQYVDPGRTSCGSDFWKQIAVFYAFQSTGDPRIVFEGAMPSGEGEGEAHGGAEAHAEGHGEESGEHAEGEAAGEGEHAEGEAAEHAENQPAAPPEKPPTQTVTSEAPQNVTPVRFASRPPLPPSAQHRFRQKAKRMPVPPPTPGSFSAPQLNRRERAKQDEKAWKDAMDRMNGGGDRVLAPWARRR